MTQIITDASPMRRLLFDLRLSLSHSCRHPRSGRQVGGTTPHFRSGAHKDQLPQDIRQLLSSVNLQMLTNTPTLRPPAGGHQVVTRPKIEPRPHPANAENPRALTPAVSCPETATSIRHGFAFRYSLLPQRQPTSPPPLFHDIQQLHIEN